MKKFIAIAIAAGSVAAMPATASASTADTSVACTKPLVECAFDLAVWAAQQADPVTIINTARGVVRQGGDLVDDVCDIVLGTCNVPTP